MAGHIGHGDPQQLPVGQRVPHSDVLLGAGGDRTGTSGGDTQKAEQTRTTQSAGNKHGAQQ